MQYISCCQTRQIHKKKERQPRATALLRSQPALEIQRSNRPRVGCYHMGTIGDYAGSAEAHIRLLWRSDWVLM